MQYSFSEKALKQENSTQTMKLNRSSEPVGNSTESVDTEKQSVGWSWSSPSYFNYNHDSGDR